MSYCSAILSIRLVIFSALISNSVSVICLLRSLDTNDCICSFSVLSFFVSSKDLVAPSTSKSATLSLKPTPLTRADSSVPGVLNGDSTPISNFFYNLQSAPKSTSLDLKQGLRQDSEAATA